jgi:hypothetical protein
VLCEVGGAAGAGAAVGFAVAGAVARRGVALALVPVAEPEGEPVDGLP